MSLRTSDLRYVDLPDGGRLAYAERGTGAPVVLLHGGVLDHRSWTPQLDSWADEHRVLAVDARGHGWSSTPTAPFRLCDDLAAFLTALDLAPAPLVGVSMGAGTAVDLALEYPGLVSRLVISGTGTSEASFTDPWSIEQVARWHAAAERHDLPAWLDCFMDLAPGPYRALDDLDPGLVADLRGMAEHTVATHMADGPPLLPTPVTRTWERTPRIDVPVLAVPGTLDSESHVRMATELADMVPDGRVAAVDGASHYPNLEQVGRFDAVVRPFLTA